MALRLRLLIVVVVFYSYKTCVFSRISSIWNAPSSDYIDDWVAHTNVGSHFNATTGTFTVPLTGVYFFADFLMTNNSNGTIDFHLQINGSVEQVFASDGALFSG